MTVLIIVLILAALVVAGLMYAKNAQRKGKVLLRPSAPELTDRPKKDQP